MIPIFRNTVKKLYNLTEGQDIHKTHYKKIMSDKVIIKGTNAG